MTLEEAAREILSQFKAPRWSGDDDPLLGAGRVDVPRCSLRMLRDALSALDVDPVDATNSHDGASELTLVETIESDLAAGRNVVLDNKHWTLVCTALRRSASTTESWRSMLTAPRDGTIIELWFGSILKGESGSSLNGDCVENCRWDQTRERWTNGHRSWDESQFPFWRSGKASK